jgi:putative ABC transport system substrate-binding protein
MKADWFASHDALLTFWKSGKDALECFPPRRRPAVVVSLCGLARQRCRGQRGNLTAKISASPVAAKAGIHFPARGARLGQKIITFKADSEQEIDAAFSAIAKSGAGALFIGAGQFLNSRRSQLVGLAALHAIPASYVLSGAVEAGGLMSYGASQTDAYRRAGIYAARILNGEKPGDLPVELPDKYELSINLKTAKALGLTVPPTLIARAEQVIE